jgi:hypothetical protein
VSQKVQIQTFQPSSPRHATLAVMSQTITEACELLEGSPQTKWDRLVITTQMTDDEEEDFSIEVELRNELKAQFVFSDRWLMIDPWRRFGRAVGNSNLHTLEIGVDMFDDIFELYDRWMELFDGAAWCIEEFVAEVKYSTTIVDATIELDYRSINDLGHFISNNKSSWRALELVAENVPVSLEWSDVLSRAIRNVRLEKVNILRCRFGDGERASEAEDDGSFEQILEGCSTVEELQVGCLSNSDCTAVAAILQDPTSVLSTHFHLL